MVLLVVFYCCVLLICTLQRSMSDREAVLSQIRQHIEGVTYESLKDVFQSYPVDRSHTDQDWKIFRTCAGLSGHREILHADSGQRLWRVTKPCYSVLQNCRFDDSMENPVRFCLSRDQYRRYEYMEQSVYVGPVYGRKFNRKCPSSKFEKYYSYAYYPCLCDCESSQREADRYFSLLDVISDYNKVVTGVRFRKIDHVFYIQIQQVELGWNKIIRGNAEWKEVRRVSRWELLSSNVSEYYKQEGNDDDLLKFHKNDLVYAVTSEQNTVLLDDLVGGPKEVLTGLRFRRVGKDLGLEIRVTPFDDNTATLDKSASRWLRNDVDKSKREEAKLLSTIVPKQSNSMSTISYKNQFIKFQVSDFKTDLGQTTVPFIDLTKVAPKQTQALYGAGIFHRGNSDSAGFISLRVIV